jgi:hypothetical protein
VTWSWLRCMRRSRALGEVVEQNRVRKFRNAFDIDTGSCCSARAAWFFGGLDAHPDALAPARRALTIEPADELALVRGQSPSPARLRTQARTPTPSEATRAPCACTIRSGPQCALAKARMSLVIPGRVHLPARNSRTRTTAVACFGDATTAVLVSQRSSRGLAPVHGCSRPIAFRRLAATKAARLSFKPAARMLRTRRRPQSPTTPFGPGGAVGWRVLGVAHEALVASNLLAGSSTMSNSAGTVRSFACSNPGTLRKSAPSLTRT